MTDPSPDLWQYPAEHQEAAQELLIQQRALQARLHGSEERIKTLRKRLRFAVTRLTWLGVGIALGAVVASFSGLGSTLTELLSAGGLMIVLIAMFVLARSRQQIDRITQVQDAEAEAEAALEDLMHYIDDLNLWQLTVRARILEKLDKPVSFQTKQDYFIVLLGSVVLILILAIRFS